MYLMCEWVASAKNRMTNVRATTSTPYACTAHSAYGGKCTAGTKSNIELHATVCDTRCSDNDNNNNRRVNYVRRPDSFSKWSARHRGRARMGTVPQRRRHNENKKQARNQFVLLNSISFNCLWTIDGNARHAHRAQFRTQQCVRK